MKKEEIDKLDELIKTSEQVKYSQRVNLLLIFVGLVFSLLGFLIITFSHISHDFLPYAAMICVVGGLLVGYSADERSWENLIRQYPWLILNSDALKNIRNFENTGEMNKDIEKIYGLYKELDKYFKNIR